jgi:tetratricopeptide (TPR) repeat protein/predicted AlkP superfamily phosphohydrolase/phosphomutase
MSILSGPRNLALTLAALLVVAWAGASVRRIEGADSHIVIDTPLLGMAPRLVRPGWHFVPRFIGRVSIYPASPRKLKSELTGERAAKSREGANVEVEAELTYLIPPEGVLDLHRAQGPAYESGWLVDLVRGETAARVASVSYDVVRNRDPELVQGVRALIDQKTAGSGIRVQGLRIVQVASVGEASADIARPDVKLLEREVVIIGVDSFSWRVIDPLLQKGRMPNLARLIARGARSNLKSIRPILSPVVWTSIATGVKPSRHGIVDFVVAARDTGALMPVTSVMRQVPAIWNLLSRQGIDVNVVAWWATWPAETVRGTIVTDRVAFQLFEDRIKEDWRSTDPARNKGKTWPAGLMDEIRPLIRVPAEVTDEEVGWFFAGGKIPSSLTSEQRDLIRTFRTLIAAGQTYQAVALRQFHEPGPRLKMVYYEGPDEASHLFMRYRPPLLPGTSQADADLFGTVVDRYYERQDRYIGEILDAVGKDATIILCSDHGFKSDNDRPPNSDPQIGKADAAAWHTPIGVLVMAGPDIPRGVTLGAASVLDIVPTVLSLYGLPVARDMDGQPLTEGLAPGFLSEHPISWIDSYGGIRKAPEQMAGAGAPSTDDAEMIEKLRSLGYIGDEQLTARNNRATLALDEGDTEGAIEQLEGALAKGDEGGAMMRANLARAYFIKGDLDKAQSLAQQVLVEEPANKQAMMILASVETQRKNLTGAMSLLKQVIGLDPTYAQAHTRLGQAYEEMGREDEALAEYQKVVEIEPLSPIELNNIGNIFRKRGQIDRAMEAYREALRCDARHIGAYNNLGLCLQEKGQLDEARKLYEKALAIRPENSILRNSMGTLVALKGDREGALAEFQRAVSSDPNWPVAQSNLAATLMEVGRYDEGKAAFEKLVQLEPESVESHLGLGLACLIVQQQPEAIAQFGEVLKRDPENLRAHIALGETFLRGGDLDKAQEHLERAARLNDGIARVYNSLAEIYLKRGRRQDAAGALQKSLTLEPGQKAVRQRLAALGG